MSGWGTPRISGSFSFWRPREAQDFSLRTVRVISHEMGKEKKKKKEDKAKKVTRKAGETKHKISAADKRRA